MSMNTHLPLTLVYESSWLWLKGVEIESVLDNLPTCDDNVWITVEYDGIDGDILDAILGSHMWDF